jgi:hypothetical protein
MPRSAMISAILGLLGLVGCMGSGPHTNGAILPTVHYKKGLDAAVVRTPLLRPCRGRAAFEVAFWYDEAYWGARRSPRSSKTMWFDWEIGDRSDHLSLALEIRSPLWQFRADDQHYEPTAMYATVALSPEGAVRQIKLVDGRKDAASSMPAETAGDEDLIRAMTHLLIPQLTKREFRKGESLGHFKIPLQPLVAGMRDLAPETVYEGLRIVQGRDALVFLYADETVQDRMHARINGFYAIDRNNLRSLAAESSLSLTHQGALVYYERTRLRSEDDNRIQATKR